MNLKEYIDLHQLLQYGLLDHKKNRAFIINGSLETKSPIDKLKAWVNSHKSELKKPLLSDKIEKQIHRVSLVLGVIALIAGFLTGVALLSYSGKEPVNLIYFLAVAVFLPLFTMSLSLLAMLNADRSEAALVHISPAYWLEKLMSFLSGSNSDAVPKIQISPLIANWLVIKRSQLLALLFSIGLLLALLGVVVTRDIAFAWSTTLHISAEEFYSFVYALALPWREWLPTAIPSLEIVQASQYFRLGGNLDKDMIANAAALGEWWKFLVCAVVFYTILPRSILWIVAKQGYKNAITKSAIRLNGAQQLLYQMDTPVVSTTAFDNETQFKQSIGRHSQRIDKLRKHYDSVLGWSIDSDTIIVLNDAMEIETDQVFEAGGANTLKQDQSIISNSMNSSILLYVKSWEPPTMDTVDFIDELGSKSESLVVAPIGLSDNEYRPKTKDINIWSKKLSTIENEKVWLWQPNS